jgi:hypothetical protein
MIEWSPSEFMNRSPQHTYLLVLSIMQASADDFNRIQDSLSILNVKEVKEDLYLIFSHETHAQLSKRLFDGIDPQTKALLILISDTAAAPISSQIEQNQGER